MGTYLFLRYKLFWQQAAAAFAPLQQFSFLLVLIAGHALVGLVAPLGLLGFQLFNPELNTQERWPYLQMLMVIMFCWQGAVAWQQKPAAEQYFVESLAPSARIACFGHKLMALLNQLPLWLFTVPVMIYLLLNSKTMVWLDFVQLLLLLLLLCWGFQAHQTSWLALLALFVVPVMTLWSVPLLVLMVLERALQSLCSEKHFSAASLFQYWLGWFISMQQNKALLLLIIFVLALWKYWLEQHLKPEALLFIHSVFIWGVALLCYAQQKLWQQHLGAQHYFWQSYCTAGQRLVLKLVNLWPVLSCVLLALVVFQAEVAVWTIVLAVLLSLVPQLRLLSVALCCFIVLILLNGQGF